MDTRPTVARTECIAAHHKELTMDVDQAYAEIAERDDAERSGRAERLVALVDLLSDAPVPVAGQAAEWLFEDVKATWIYGYFTSTVVTAHAFCIQQLTGSLRTRTDVLDSVEGPLTLEALAATAQRQGLIDLDLQAQLLRLKDAAGPYLDTSSVDARALESRVAEADEFSDEHALLADARAALTCAIWMLSVC